MTNDSNLKYRIGGRSSRWGRNRRRSHLRGTATVDAAGPEQTAAGHAHHDVDHKQQDRPDQAVHPDAAPEHGAGQVAGRLAERDGLEE